MVIKTNLRDGIAHAALRWLEGGLAVGVVRRVLRHHGGDADVVRPVVHVVVARLAVHLPVHLLAIAAGQVLPPCLKVVLKGSRADIILDVGDDSVGK